MPQLIINDVLMDETEATLPATDRALTHGLGLYETIKLIDGVPVFFEEHILRLERGIAALGLDNEIDKPKLAGQILRLSEANGGTDNSCRLLVTAGPPGGTPNLLVQTDRRDFPARPLRVISYRGVRVSAQYKAMTVMQSYFAQRAARAAGVDDALLVDDESRIFEGSTSNVFVLRAGVLVTPPAEGDILPGVIRAKIDELAGAAGIPVVDAWTRVVDLHPEDGLLLTSSVRGTVAVEQVDDVRLSVPERELARLRALIDEAEAASAAAFSATYRA
ncbi:MAG TPA: aminotransferase class IV [Thermoleophilia bacterium]|nr:aminotransferase class IV [Thermoleophilia bacterium]